MAARFTPLWDTYTIADLVTYPSLWEGWGNQLLEAVKAKLPLVIYEYPVYQRDIHSAGFRMVSLGDRISGRDQHNLVQVKRQVQEKAADEALDLLTDQGLRLEVVNHNLQVARDHFSLSTLKNRLAPYFDEPETK